MQKRSISESSSDKSEQEWITQTEYINETNLELSLKDLKKKDSHKKENLEEIKEETLSQGKLSDEAHKVQQRSRSHSP